MPVNFFSDHNIKNDLAKKTISGGALSIAVQAIVLILHFISLSILARLLTPEAFGIVAMVTAFTNLAVLFSEMGLSTATIQRKEIRETEISALFWANFLIGILLTSICIFLSEVISDFYNNPKVQNIVMVTATGFIFSALTIQHEALLRRHLYLGRINVVYLAANILSMLVGISCALFGLGYWSLVLMTLSLSFFKMLGIWIACRWVPKINFNFKSVTEYLKFGFNLTGFNFINYFSRNLDKILIGKFISVEALGEFSRVVQISLFPIRKVNGPLGASIIPALARTRNEPSKYKEYYRNSLKSVSFIGTPIVCFFFVRAEEIVLLLLGEQWTGIGVILQCLFPAALCAVTNTATGWVYNSLGHVNRQLKWSYYASTILCISVIAGINWGVIGVALAISLSRTLLKVPGLLFCYKGTFLKLIDFLSSFLPSLFLSFIPALCIYLFGKIFLSSLPSELILLFSFIIFSKLYLILMYCFYKEFFTQAVQWISVIMKFSKNRSS